jgi:glutamyl-tRNA reductase
VTVSLLAVGISHRDAGVDVRESVYLDGEGRARLRGTLAGGEVVVLSTCNRTEVYLADGAADVDAVVAALLGRPGAPPRQDAARAVFTRFGPDVAHHLLRVASGLESVVPGEPEILGQVRAAWMESQRDGRCGPVLNALFQRALETGRRVRAETQLARRPASVASAAVELADRSAEGLARKRVLVLGAGAMSRAICSSAARRGAQLTVAARDPARAAEALGPAVAVARLDELGGLLARADVVIAATSALQPLVTRAAVAASGRALVLIDLGMPRNVEADVATLERCQLHDVDDLRLVVEETLASRAGASESAERILERDLARFADWLLARDLRAEIDAARERAEEFRQRELSRLAESATDTCSQTKLERCASKAAGRFLHEELIRLKALRTAA